MFRKRRKRGERLKTKSCYQCGHKNTANARFCTQCGAELTTESIKKDYIFQQEEKVSSPKKEKKGKFVLFSLLGVAVCVGIACVFCWVTYPLSMQQGKAAMEERDFASAVKNFKAATFKKPTDVEAYYLLATAYTESRDLYSAKETLNRGYKLTKDESLQKVSIWGPASVVELAYCYAETRSAPTRIEYEFYDDKAEGYFSKHHLHEVVFEYFFDEDGKIAYTRADVADGGRYTFGTGNFTVFHWYGIAPYNDLTSNSIFKYNYNEDGEIISLENAAFSSDGEIMMEFEYDKNQCEEIAVRFNDHQIGLILSYDSMGRPVVVDASGQGNHFIYEYTYTDDNGYYVKECFPDKEIMSVETYHSNGQFLNHTPARGWENIDAFIETQLDANDRVISITTSNEYDQQTYEYSYQDDGNMKQLKFEIVEQISQEKEEYRADLSYSSVGKLTRINYLIQTTGKPTITATREITYAEDGYGFCTRMRQTTDSDEISASSLTWEVEYMYLDGQLWRITHHAPGEAEETQEIQYNEASVPVGTLYIYKG